MRVALAALALCGIAPTVAADQVNSGLFGWAPGDNSTPYQRYIKRVGDGFGQCVVRRAPEEAQAFVDAALAGSVPVKTPVLVDAVNDCLADRNRKARTVLILEQDTAIYRAILRKNGKPLPS